MRDEENEQQRSHQRVILAKSILKDEITYQRSDSNQQSRVPKSVPEICEYWVYWTKSDIINWRRSKRKKDTRLRELITNAQAKMRGSCLRRATTLPSGASISNSIGEMVSWVLLVNLTNGYLRRQQDTDVGMHACLSIKVWLRDMWSNLCVAHTLDCWTWKAEWIPKDRSSSIPRNSPPCPLTRWPNLSQAYSSPTWPVRQFWETVWMRRANSGRSSQNHQQNIAIHQYPIRQDSLNEIKPHRKTYFVQLVLQFFKAPVYVIS